MSAPYNPYANVAPSAPLNPMGGGGTPPKKYTKINGVMKLNPEFQRWKEAQGGGPATTIKNSGQALAVVTNMEDHAAFSEASIATGGKEIPLSEATNATIEMMQEPEICLGAGMQPDEMVDQLGAILNKYEVPMGLMNKLMMLSEFQQLEFMIDDSGSMTLQSDTTGPTGQLQTRWQEALGRLKEMIEILAYVPFEEIVIIFLNRPDRLSLKRNGRNPKTFLADAYQQIDNVFRKSPSGTTPALERIQESFVRGQGKNISRYFFGDGLPNGGIPAKTELVRLLCNRQNPAGNPFTFLSCTNEDEQVEWMKDAEELAPYCAECDDFQDESEEVLRDQGQALPFSRGFYLICCLVAAMNPDDLDAMDESVPLTKATLDNLLGVENGEESYRHYFNCFIQAQKIRTIDRDEYGRPKRTDQLKKDVNWEASYQDFLRAPLANQIPAVQAFKQQLRS